MSVAFRRDGDEEHLEPKFELPIPPGPNLVTARGKAQIEEKCGEWEAAVAAAPDEEAVKSARRHLRYWRTRAATAQEMPAPDGSCVAFGATVQFRLNGQTRTITIVGHDEADPTAGLLAFSAPLPRAMMEAEAGELVDFSGRAEAIEIVSITV